MTYSICYHLFSGISKSFRLTLSQKKPNDSHCMLHVPFQGLGDLGLAHSIHIKRLLDFEQFSCKKKPHNPPFPFISESNK